VVFLGAIVAYVAGVKVGARWGRPVLTVCVLALVLLVLDRAFFHVVVGRTFGGRPPPEPGDLREAGKRIGETLKDRLGPGRRVYVVAGYGFAGGSGAGGSGSWPLFEAGLLPALGHTELVVVGEERGSAATAETLSDACVRSAPVDAVLFVGTLPANLEEAAFYRRGHSRPIIAGYFLVAEYAETASIESIHRWLQKGRIDVAVVETKQDGLYSKMVSFEVYTPDNLPPLP
jgi:hypothetical protein